MLNVCINSISFGKQLLSIIYKLNKNLIKKTYKIKTIQKEVVEIESLKSSTQHSVNDFVVINIPEEDVEPKQIILDPDDQPMWESAKTVAPTPNSVIVQIDVDGNFVINSTHLKLICENKFDGYLRADPHDHIREFLAICNMFRYGETQSEAVKIMIFPYSLSDKAKTWFKELNEESITSNFSQNVCESLTEAWLRLKNMLRKCHRSGLTKGAIIQIFYHGLDEPTQAILDVTARGIFLCKSPNQAFKFLDDKVLFEHDWPIKSKIDHHQKSVSFADGSDSNTINSRFMEKLKAMDSQIISLNEELQKIRNKYNELRKENELYSHQSLHDPNDFEKSLTKLNNDVRNDLKNFKRCIRSKRTVHWKVYDRDDGKTTGVFLTRRASITKEEKERGIHIKKRFFKLFEVCASGWLIGWVAGRAVGDGGLWLGRWGVIGMAVEGVWGEEGDVLFELLFAGRVWMCGWRGSSRYLSRSFSAESYGVTMSLTQVEKAQVLAVAQRLTNKLNVKRDKDETTGMKYARTRVSEGVWACCNMYIKAVFRTNNKNYLRISSTLVSNKIEQKGSGSDILRKARERLEQVKNNHMLQSDGPTKDKHMHHFQHYLLRLFKLLNEFGSARHKGKEMPVKEPVTTICVFDVNHKKEQLRDNVVSVMSSQQHFPLALFCKDTALPDLLWPTFDLKTVG
ncbi:hypothetical protein Tco_0529227 [Tanacetum coccineum]